MSFGGANDGNAILGLWNQRASECPALAKVRKMTKGRLVKLRSRLADPEFRDNFRQALGKLPIPNEGDFCWQPDFDWLLANDTNVLKLLEGKYDRNGAAEEDFDQVLLKQLEGPDDGE